MSDAEPNYVKKLIGFENDLLGLQNFAISLTNLVDDSDNVRVHNDSLVMSVDSPWGTGKTTFFSMWKEHLESRIEQYNIVFYNAWQHDDYNDVLATLIAEFKSQLPKDAAWDTFDKAISKTLIKIAVHTGKSIFLDVVKNKLGVDIENIASQVTNGSIDDFYKQLKPKMEQDYDSFADAKQQFRDALTTYAANKKLLIIIDELDRCRPPYAIELLEIIKHYFNTPNSVFIFSVDMAQMNSTVSMLYGSTVEASGYLRKFFDVNLRMPLPKIENIIQSCMRTHFSYIDSSPYGEILSISRAFKLSCRDIVVIMQHLKLVLVSGIPKGQHEYGIIEYFYLVSLKYKFPDYYLTFLTKPFSFEGGQNNNFALKIPIEYSQCSTKTAKLLHKLSGGKNSDSIMSFLENVYKTFSTNGNLNWFLKTNPAYDLTDLLASADLLGIIPNQSVREIEDILSMPLGYYLDSVIEMIIPLDTHDSDYTRSNMV